MTDKQQHAPDIPTVAPPDFHPRRPAITLPPLACDCHAHICGPMARYPYYAKRHLHAADSLLPDYQDMLATLGVERAVLVQGASTDGQHGAAGGAEDGRRRFRGVAVSRRISATKNWATCTRPAFGRALQHRRYAGEQGVLPLDILLPLARRLKPLGWHVEFLLHVDEFPDLDRTLGSSRST